MSFCDQEWSTGTKKTRGRNRWVDPANRWVHQRKATGSTSCRQDGNIGGDRVPLLGSRLYNYCFILILSSSFSAKYCDPLGSPETLFNTLQCLPKGPVCLDSSCLRFSDETSLFPTSFIPFRLVQLNRNAINFLVISWKKKRIQFRTDDHPNSIFNLDAKLHFQNSFTFPWFITE